MPGDNAHMLLMIDNYDSFTYNLVQYLGELGAQVEVYRNDCISIADIAHMGPQWIVISPGPCSPNEAGISLGVVQRFAGHVPMLGVCLGHQCIAQAFGARIVHAQAHACHDERGGAHQSSCRSRCRRARRGSSVHGDECSGSPMPVQVCRHPRA